VAHGGRAPARDSVRHSRAVAAMHRSNHHSFSLLRYSSQYPKLSALTVPAAAARHRVTAKTNSPRPSRHNRGTAFTQNSGHYRSDRGLAVPQSSGALQVAPAIRLYAEDRDLNFFRSIRNLIVNKLGSYDFRVSFVLLPRYGVKAMLNSSFSRCCAWNASVKDAHSCIHLRSRRVGCITKGARPVRRAGIRT
jgi:hypothetical protein